MAVVLGLMSTACTPPKNDAPYWCSSLVTLEAGSCGFLSLPSFNTLKQQLLEWWENLLINIAQAAIKSSH